jgi:hypothetical protein
MTVWEAILLGIIQDTFKFFPVSSTSHLVLTLPYRSRFRCFSDYVWFLARVIVVGSARGVQ